MAEPYGIPPGSGRPDHRNDPDPQRAYDIYPENRVTDSLYRGQDLGTANREGLRGQPTASGQGERPRTRKNVMILGVSALAVVLGFWGCSSHDQGVSDDEYAQVCRDETTQQRVDDANCGDTDGTGHTGVGSHFAWFYLGSRLAGSGGSVPAVGQRLSQGTTSRPSNGTIYSGIPSDGGSFSSSYKAAKSTSNVSGGKTTSKTSGGKSGSGGSRSGTGSKGGFGGGSKSGGGRSGG